MSEIMDVADFLAADEDARQKALGEALNEADNAKYRAARLQAAQAAVLLRAVYPQAASVLVSVEYGGTSDVSVTVQEARAADGVVLWDIDEVEFADDEEQNSEAEDHLEAASELGLVDLEGSREAVLDLRTGEVAWL